MESKVLQLLKAEKLPPPEIACRACQYATWMEFKAGPKCYCAITQAWMYEPNQQPGQMVLSCDKQLELDAGETAPKATATPGVLVHAGLGLEALAGMPRKPATMESVIG